MIIETLEQLESLYGTPSEAALIKEKDHLIPTYRAFIEAAPFVALATIGPGGLDCSPRGEAPAVVHIADDKTILMPDRRGNNRLDSLRNIVSDPRVALMFLIPGSSSCLRINGRARLNSDAELRHSLAVDDKPPACVIEIRINQVYFQCARAIIRARLWQGDVAPADLPSAGDMLRDASNGDFDGKSYDAQWPARAKKTLW